MFGQMHKYRVAGLTAALLLASPGAFAKDTVLVGLPSIYPPYVGLFVAQKEGYFRDLGIDVEITQYRSGSATLEAIAAGAADVVAAPPASVAVGVQQGLQAKVVSTFGTLVGWRILVRADSNVRRVEDLAGKTIGITGKASLTDFLALHAASEAKIEMQTIPLGNGVMPALNARQVDSTVIWPPLSYNLLQGDKYRSIADFAGLKDVPTTTWVASSKTIKEKPTAIKAFLSGFKRALIKLQGDEAYALQALQDYTEETNRAVLKQAYDEMIKPADPEGIVTLQGVTAALDFGQVKGIGAAQIVDTQFVPIQ